MKKSPYLDMFSVIPLITLQSPFRSTSPLSFRLAKNCQRPLYHEFHTRNPKSDMMRRFLVAIKSKPHHQNFQFPAHFRSTEFWNFNFQFSCISPKDAQLNFRGSTWENFSDTELLGTVNPYWQHFGTITECHFRKQNPQFFFIVTILVTSYIEHLKSCYHISKQQGVFYLYQKYFKHVTSSSAEICVGFCFRKWRSVTHPIFGFCFRDLPIWVKGWYIVYWTSSIFSLERSRVYRENRALT